MILIYFTLLNIIAFLFFKKANHTLHILEKIVYWMFSSYIYQNFSAFHFMNSKTLVIPDDPVYAYTHVLNRIVLYPMLMLTFLHFYLSAQTFWKKAVLFVSYLLLFLGIEWVTNFVGVLVHVHWHLWWSVAFWIIAFCALIGFMKVFRKFLFKRSTVT